MSRLVALKKIEKLISDFLESLKENKVPFFNLKDVSNWKNIK